MNRPQVAADKWNAAEQTKPVPSERHPRAIDEDADERIEWNIDGGGSIRTRRHRGERQALVTAEEAGM